MGLNFIPKYLETIAYFLTPLRTYSLLIIAFLVFASCNRKGLIIKFEPGKISTSAVEYSSSFSFSGEEVYFAKSDQEWGEENIESSIYFAIKKNGRWSTPKLASFSGQYDDGDPHLTRDGKTLYFISNRPSEAILGSHDIWMVEKDETGTWGAPVRLPYPFNTESREYCPRTDAIGNLYFVSDRPGGYGQGDLYVSKIRDKLLTYPINLGNTINSPKGEWNFEVNEEGDVLIFEASQREQNVSVYGDLYISFKNNELWTIPQNIEELNTSGSDLYPYLSRGQHLLYYTSSDSLKGTSTNIYFTEFDPIYDTYKKQAKTPTKYLIVVNRSSHDVSIINTTLHKLNRKVPVGIGPHEISVSTDNKYAFIANYGSYPKPHQTEISPQALQWIDDPQNTITKIDLTTMEAQTFTIPGNFSYHGILTNYDGSKFWTTSENEGIVKEVDGIDGTIIQEYITMPGSHILRSTKDFLKIFVSNIESNTVSAIDIKTQEVTTISTPKGPEGMNVSLDDKNLWILCNNANEVMVIDTKSLELVKTFDSNGKFPVKLTFINDEAWIVNVFTQNISIFDVFTFEFKEHIALESSPLGITSDEENVFITLPRKNIVRVYDSKTRKKIQDYPYGMEQDGMFLLNDIEDVISE